MHRAGLTTRLAGACGVAFVVLTVLPVAIVPPPPPAGTSTADVFLYYTANRPLLLFGAWLAALGFVPSFIYLARIVAIVRDAEGERSWLWLASAFGLVAAFAAIVVLTALGAVLPFSAAAVGPEATRALADLMQLTFAVYFFPITAFFLGVGVVTRAGRGLPGWLGQAAFVVAAAAVIAPLGMFVDWTPLRPGGTYSLFAFGLQLIWWFAAAVLLVLRPGADPA